MASEDLKSRQGPVFAPHGWGSPAGKTHQWERVSGITWRFLHSHIHCLGWDALEAGLHCCLEPKCGTSCHLCFLTAWPLIHAGRAARGTIWRGRDSRVMKSCSITFLPMLLVRHES